jgi:hypothetical protein
MDITQIASGIRPETGGTDREDRSVPPLLEFEMALELCGGEDRSWTEAVKAAADAAGGDLVFILPAADARGEVREHAMVRLREGGGESLLFVRRAEDGLSVLSEADIDGEVADFARASIAVLERIRTDERIVEPLVADRSEPAAGAA